MKLTLHHINLATEKVEEMDAFYSTVMGLEVPDRDPLSVAFAFDLNHYLPDDLLLKTDYATIACGLEAPLGEEARYPPGHLHVLGSPGESAQISVRGHLLHPPPRGYRRPDPGTGPLRHTGPGGHDARIPPLHRSSPVVARGDHLRALRR